MAIQTRIRIRPVDRGPWPTDKKNNNKNYTPKYGDAVGPLKERLGWYCSFCERPIETHLAVEHISPKEPNGKLLIDRVGDWNNFLLACGNCNSVKGKKEPTGCLLPDRDNTFRALVYSRERLVTAAPGIAEDQARALLALVGLDRLVALYEKKTGKGQTTSFLS